MFYQTNVVTNQNLQLLCYVTFFDILHHYGVIVASLICSVEKVLCRLTEQIFFGGDFPGSFQHDEKKENKCPSILIGLY